MHIPREEAPDSRPRGRSYRYQPYASNVPLAAAFIAIGS